VVVWCGLGLAATLMAFMVEVCVDREAWFVVPRCFVMG